MSLWRAKVWVGQMRENTWGVLDTYEHTIKLLHPTVATYCTKLASLIEFCNSVTRDLPWRLDNNLKDMDGNDTHPTMCNLVLICERMMWRFKDELKDLKEWVAKKTFRLLLCTIPVLTQITVFGLIFCTHLTIILNTSGFIWMNGCCLFAPASDFIFYYVLFILLSKYVLTTAKFIKIPENKTKQTKNASMHSYILQIK